MATAKKPAGTAPTRSTSTTTAAKAPAKSASKTAAKTAAKAAPAKTAAKTASKTTAAKKAPSKDTAGKRGPNPAFMKPLQPDAQLAAVVGNEPMPRTQVVARVWDYIKKNNLQESRNINADENLRPHLRQGPDHHVRDDEARQRAPFRSGGVIPATRERLRRSDAPPGGHLGGRPGARQLSGRVLPRASLSFSSWPPPLSPPALAPRSPTYAPVVAPRRLDPAGRARAAPSRDAPAAAAAPGRPHAPSSAPSCSSSSSGPSSSRRSGSPREA